MKYKKSFIIIALALVLIVTLGRYYKYQQRYNGSTLVSRELILDKKTSGIHITSEYKIDDYIVSTLVKGDSEHGLAVFEPRGNGNYKMQTGYIRENSRIVIANALINNTKYDIFWCNRDNLDYVEIKYTFMSDGSEDTIRLDAKNNTIAYTEAIQSDHMMEVTYYDIGGNKYS